eukprot:TRINITY_DN9562_c0_g1_i1.p1 TRINITY_DN9562_c0_g1~~TRINITY_DN9562_c0_g1_i1.p1  ORF type:complete len:365 (+),score=88.51 TRINITY_DN9562_c0_g1_i1:142-1236(+)
MWLAMAAAAVAAVCAEEVAVATACGGFVFMSVLLHRFPGLVHRRKVHTQLPVHISHRGGAGEAYENTLHAFDKTVAGGTCMLELDVHLTRDGVAVVAHDPTLTRMSGTAVSVADTDYADLPLLQQAVPMHFEHEPYSAADDVPPEHVPGFERVEGEAYYRGIPTLESVFERYPGVMINIDIKEHRPALVHEVDVLMKRFDRLSRTVWGSGRRNTTNLCYAVNPEVPLLCSMPRVVLIVVCFHCGLLPFVPLKERFFEIPMPSIFHRLMKPAQQSTVRTGMIHVLHALLFRASLFSHLERRGVVPLVWVLNSEEEFARAFAAGAVGVMTDYPSRLAKYLAENPHYPRPCDTSPLTQQLRPSRKVS